MTNRHILTLIIASTLPAFLSGFASAQPADVMQELNKRSDNAGTGLYPAIKEMDASLPDQVIYRPRDLDAMSDLKLGIVAWGNGGCSFDGASSRFHLLELASHGYLVIAGGRILSGPGAIDRVPVAEGEQPRRTSYVSLRQAIDWALAENRRPESPYYGRIDPDQVALSGYSCGGVQVNRVASDPRVKTLLMHNTGIFNEAPPVAIPDMNIGKEALADIHTPVIYILGGETDIAYANGMNDFKRINHVPVAVANIERDHGGTFMDENGGSAAQVALQWLNWQLRGNRQAALYFIGSDCGLCRDDSWTVERKFNGVVAP